MNGLMIRSPWIEKILSGSKTWEIRGKKTNVRGTIALIRSGTGRVYGTCELVDVIGPLSLDEMLDNLSRHCSPCDELTRGLPYPKTYAWILRNVRPLEKPLSYRHPPGAIIWVKLPDLPTHMNLTITSHLTA